MYWLECQSMTPSLRLSRGEAKLLPLNASRPALKGQFVARYYVPHNPQTGAFFDHLRFRQSVGELASGPF